METAVQQPALDLARRTHAGVDFHPWPFGPDGLERLGDAHPGLGHQVVDDADIEVTAQLLVHQVHLAAKALDGHQDRLARPQHLTPLVGQGETRPPPLAEPHAEALLQVAHVQADGRAADAQHTLGSGEAAALGNRLEQP
ncbi:hypothetical protein D9M69_549250 [compost metagenome]